MHHSGNSLNNANLDEAPLAAASYNELPHIDDMRDTATKHAIAHAKLLGPITSQSLSQHFSVHFIHKHFNIPNDRVMVYETVHGSNHPDFILCSPRQPSNVKDLRGLYFRASEGGKMVAYEYTTDLCTDLSAHANFVAKFARVVLTLGVQDVFALTAKKLQGDALTELEMPDLISTVLVNNCTWLPSVAKSSTSTDWMASPDYSSYAGTPGDSIPGIVSLKCTQTRSTSHYNVTCSRTKSGKHYQSKTPKPKPTPRPPPGPTPAHEKTTTADKLFLDGQPLDEGSEPYAIIRHARARVEAY